MPRRILLASLAFVAAPALANDSTAELGTGGLILSRSDFVSMDSEDLFISKDKVTVDYVFRNNSDADLETIVAFPMPDIEGSPFSIPAIPNDPNDNFLEFHATIDGKPVTTELEQKAFAAGIDVSAELKAQNVPFYPWGDAVYKALEKLPQAVADDWATRGMLVIDEYDDGSGWKKVRSPYWRLKSTYWWRTVFPANKAVKVAHRYRPSLGGSAGLNFFSEGKLQGDGYETYKYKYCLDGNIERAVLKAAKENPDGYPQLFENRLSYVLTTGGNWATGTIGKFKLTIDKGDPAALVSFCGQNVKKTGPTTFEMAAEDYYPARDIDILILGAWDFERGGALTGKPEERAKKHRRAKAPAKGNGG